MTKSLIQDRFERVLIVMNCFNSLPGVVSTSTVADDPDNTTKLSLGLTMFPKPGEEYKLKYLMTMMLEEFNLFSNIRCRPCLVNPGLIDVSFTHSLVDSALLATVEEKNND